MGKSSAWINGEIITMTDESARAGGLVIEDGLITYVGDSEEAADRAREKSIEIHDQKGC